VPRRRLIARRSLSIWNDDPARQGSPYLLTDFLFSPAQRLIASQTSRREMVWFINVSVSPFLKDLTDEPSETSGFYIPVGDFVEAIASFTSNQALPTR